MSTLPVYLQVVANWPGNKEKTEKRKRGTNGKRRKGEKRRAKGDERAKGGKGEERKGGEKRGEKKQRQTALETRRISERGGRAVRPMPSARPPALSATPEHQDGCQPRGGHPSGALRAIKTSVRSRTRCARHAVSPMDTKFTFASSLI